MTATRTAPAAGAPVSALDGVGETLAARLRGLGIERVQDLLFHLPLRYEDRTRITHVGALRPGMHAVVVARIEAAELRHGGRRSLLLAVSDYTGRMGVRFFHFSSAQRQRLKTGVWLRLFGEVRPGVLGLEMVHPEHQIIPGPNQTVLETSLTPVYPITQGLTQSRLRKLVGQALRLVDAQEIAELLPAAWLDELGLPPLAEALRLLHRPAPNADSPRLADAGHPARARLIVEELLAHHLSLRNVHRQVQSFNAPMIQAGRLSQRFRQQLGFELTAAQERVVRELLEDLGRGRPMMRLVQGDVGSGKTVVAAAVAIAALESGWQVALMAPTELLVEQHYHSLTGWLGPLELPVYFLGGRLRGGEREACLRRLVDGRPALAVGTHALFQEDVGFARLGLIVVDEQHRFGVHQRMALRDKGSTAGERPHQLIMTATPIPRTLAMSAYADLDTSVIDELPPGRTPVSTVAVADTRRDEVTERVAAACSQGRQAYWVCTLIEESEALQCQAAEETADVLRAALPHLTVALVHGRMKAAEKEAVMRRFKAGEIDLLVATTVIEVGVDVPNASLLVIENAERLGLAQLHQLRGRVGRGAVASHCVLMYHAPLSANARARLKALRETQDGFEIARRDLELRGPGEVLGTRQTGLVRMKVADLMRDSAWIETIQRLADRLPQERPQAMEPLVRRWLGDGQRYAEV